MGSGDYACAFQSLKYATERVMQSAAMAEKKEDAEANLIALKELTEDLNSVAADWFELGVQLDIEDGELRGVSGKENAAAKCFQKTLSLWWKSGTPTLKAITDALRSRVIGHNNLAIKVEKEFTDKPLKQKALLNALTPVTAKWSSFGIQLGVDHDKLKEFEDFTRNVKYYLSETLQIWLAQKDPPPTVQDLLDALRSPVLSNHVLAKKLEKKYKGRKLNVEQEEDPDIN